MKLNTLKFFIEITSFLFSIILGVIAYFISEKQIVFSIVLGLSTTFLGIFISTLFQEIPNEILRNSINELLSNNFTKIIERRDEIIDIHIINILKNAKHLKKITYLHISALNLITYKNEIQKILRYVDIELFLLKDEHILEKRKSEINISDNKFNDQNWSDFINQMNGSNHTLTIYTYDLIPYYSAIIMDFLNNERDLYITQHIFRNNAKKCPTLVLKKYDKLYDIYNNNLNETLNEIRKNNPSFKSMKKNKK